MKQFFYQYRHALAFLYLPLYLVCFFYLENRNTKNYHVIKLNLDDLIPFNEWFVIPYMYWFVFITGMFVYTMLYDIKIYKRLFKYLTINFSILVLLSPKFTSTETSIS